MHEVAVFASPFDASYDRGQDVVVATDRGVEVGTVLGQAAAEAVENGETEQAATSPDDKWRLLRTLGPDDRAALVANEARRKGEFDRWRRHLARLPIPVELVDVDYPLTGDAVILHVLAEPGADLSAVADTLSKIAGKRLVFQRFGDDPAARKQGGCSGNCTCGRREG
jgi:cell fate regulator YaaT (PSP1 superfamily)